MEAQRLTLQCYLNLLHYHVSTKGMLISDNSQDSRILSNQLLQYVNLLDYHISAESMLSGTFIEELLAILKVIYRSHNSIKIPTNYLISVFNIHPERSDQSQCSKVRFLNCFNSC